MNNKRISLRQLTVLASDLEASDAYLRYAAGLGGNHQYRSQEIEGVSSLIDFLGLDDREGEGFLYSYSLPRLNKEFDLLKVMERDVLDIELKSLEKPIPDMKKQLVQNLHYLRLLHKTAHMFCFISSTRKLYQLKSGEFVEAEKEDLRKAIGLGKSVDIDLDKEFSPDKILVSPVKNPIRFSEGDYLLTEHQESIKRLMQTEAKKSEPPYFIGLAGASGTGKTLLLYDLAKQFSSRSKPLIVIRGKKSKGHEELESLIPNLRIIPIGKVEQSDIDSSDYVFIDEANALHKTDLDLLKEWICAYRKACFLFFDPDRKPYDAEEVSMVESIQNLCKNQLFRLSFRARVNKEMARFIACLRNLSKFSPLYRFDHIHLCYEDDKARIPALLKQYRDEGYTYIPLIPFPTTLEETDEEPIMQTYEAMGQEYEKVVVILDDHYYYEGDRIRGVPHPNPAYMYTQLLYQAISRARSELSLIILDRNLLLKLLTLFPVSQ